MSFWAEILVHTSFFAAFLTGFYFIFVTYIQRVSLTNDLFNAFQPNIINSAVWSDPSKINDALGQLDEIINKAESSQGFTQDEAQIEFQNKQISTNIAIIMGVVCPILLIAGLLLEYYSGGSIYDLLISNLIVIGFIAASEFFIVGVFMKNFIEIDANFISAAPLSSDYHDFVYEFLQQVLPQWILQKFFPWKTDKVKKERY
jgi:hypothetical protein